MPWYNCLSKGQFEFDSRGPLIEIRKEDELLYN